MPGDPEGALALHCIHQLNKQYDIKRLSEEDGAAERDDNAEESLADLDAFTTALQNVRPAQTPHALYFFSIDVNIFPHVFALFFQSSLTRRLDVIYIYIYFPADIDGQWALPKLGATVDATPAARQKRYASDALKYSISQGSARFKSPGWAVFSSGGCDYARIKTEVVCGGVPNNATNAINAAYMTNATRSSNTTNCTTVQTKVGRVGALGDCDWIPTEDACTTAAFTLGLSVQLLVRDLFLETAHARLSLSYPPYPLT